MSNRIISEFKTSKEDLDLIESVKEKNFTAAFELLKKIENEYTKNNNPIYVITSESLTGGIIMSSLVDIPFVGWSKYGCLGVYDTDAKRVFNSVKVGNVYTHECAKQMAIGALNNSNASLAISVTGNAMPYPDNLFSLGEVFIGIAGYTKRNGKDVIIYRTYCINNCISKEIVGKQISSRCKSWISEHSEDKYPDRKNTASISIMIRNYTSYKALSKALDFIKENKLIVPEFVKKRRIKNQKLDKNQNHEYIPKSKYPGIEILDISPNDRKKGKKLNQSFMTSY